MRRFPLFAALAALAAATAAQTTLTGKVQSVQGTEVRIALDGALDPRAGDEVLIHFQIPGGPKVLVGKWRVARVEGAAVVATQVEATGTPAPDQTATISSTSPQPRRAAPPAQPPSAGGASAAENWTATTTGTARLRHQGREYDARWQREMSGGRAVDTYYFPTPAAAGAAAYVGGQPLWNRFVRAPADDVPDQTGGTWWLSVWEYVDGTWRQRDTRDEPVELLSRTPAP